MNRRLKEAKIKDIAITDLIFYNKEKEELLKQFCYRNRISYLPAEDRKSVYKLIESGFSQIPLILDYCLSPDELLFDENTVNKFEKVDEHEIKFVVDQEEIVGVVHIVDYNNEYVAVEMYRAFFRFENNLRMLLKNKGYTNEDFIKWVKVNSKYEQDNGRGDYWTSKYNKLSKNEKERKSAYLFQTFYLSDMLLYALHLKLLDETIFQTKHLRNLRNYTAHSRHFISVGISEVEQLVYNFDDLKMFVKSIKEFLVASDELEKLLAHSENDGFQF